MKKFKHIPLKPFSISLIGFLTLVLTVSAPIANLSLFQTSQVLAQTSANRQAKADQLLNQGMEQFQSSHFTTAIAFFQQALSIYRQINNNDGEGQSLGHLGVVYDAMGDYSKAIDYQQESLAIAREIKDRLGEGHTLNNLGVAFQKSGNFPEAEKTLYQGIQVWESLRGKLGKNDSYKVSIFEQQAQTYYTLQQVLIAEHKPNQALEISERARSRAFIELSPSYLSNSNTGQTAKSSVSKPTISLLQQIAKQENSTLVEYSIIYDDFKIEGKRQSKESELYIWVIKPTGEITFRQADLKPLWQNEKLALADIVNISRESIGVIDRGIKIDYPVKNRHNALTMEAGLRQLHELLITPIADILPTKETEKIVFIPQGSLFSVPFPALTDEHGKYLIEKHAILTAPSIQVLDLIYQRKIARRKSEVLPGEVLIVGNPTMPKVPISGEHLYPLPGAEQEAIEIAKLFKTKAIVHNDATKAAVIQKMLKARIIHFATNGFVDDLKGLGVPGAIALAPSGEDDGWLTSAEIMNLPLQADLVVLSGCDTARGKITSDGIVGLSRSFLTAGANSVIGSLWNISDNATEFLMIDFYHELSKNPDKAKALRQAMLITMKKYPGPMNWAAFTLIGESE